jgi:hypothetical protein
MQLTETIALLRYKIQIREEVFDFFFRSFRSVRPMDGVFVDGGCEILTDGAWTAASLGLVAPMTSRFFAIAFSPRRTTATIGPEDMNSVNAPKNGRSR